LKRKGKDINNISDKKAVLERWMIGNGPHHQQGQKSPELSMMTLKWRWWKVNTYISTSLCNTLCCLHPCCFQPIVPSIQVIPLQAEPAMHLSPCNLSSTGYSNTSSTRYRSQICLYLSSLSAMANINDWIDFRYHICAAAMAFEWW